MTPDQEKFIEILEAAGKRALGSGVAGVFVVVACTDGEPMIVRWHSVNQGPAALLLTGLVEIGAQKLREYTFANFGKNDATTPQGPVLRLVPPTEGT